MPTKALPRKPDLSRLKSQAADLASQHARAQPQALQRLREFHPRFAGLPDEAIAAANLAWSDALYAIAREYGFRSWPRLKARVDKPDPAADLPHHQRIADPAFRLAVELADDGDIVELGRWLAAHPGLARQRVEFEGGNYFTNPGLIGFVAENPVRQDSMPPNVIDVARTILEAGAKTDREAVNEALALTASGRVARESGWQTGLIDLFCDYGASPDGAMASALAHGEFAAARALLARGARLSLPVAAALGLEPEIAPTLAASTEAERRLAFALAAQFGRAAVVETLLDAGMDPSAYNPPGAHAHSTPLHQAALAGHEEVVRLLLRRGARRDLRDALFQGSPADWARHGGHAGIARLIDEE